MVNYDGPPDHLVDLKDYLNRDLDIIRPNILRKEMDVERPCDIGQCFFGELTDDIRAQVKFYKTVKQL